MNAFERRRGRPRARVELAALFEAQNQGGRAHRDTGGVSQGHGHALRTGSLPNRVRPEPAKDVLQRGTRKDSRQAQDERWVASSTSTDHSPAPRSTASCPAPHKPRSPHRPGVSSRPASTTLAPGATPRRKLGRQLDQRPGEDVGDEQVERRAGGEHADGPCRRRPRAAARPRRGRAARR